MLGLGGSHCCVVLASLSPPSHSQSVSLSGCAVYSYYSETERESKSNLKDMAKPKQPPPHAPPPPPPPPPVEGKPKPPPHAPPPPPPEAKKSFMRRMFPFLLAANVFVGGQLTPFLLYLAYPMPRPCHLPYLYRCAATPPCGITSVPRADYCWSHQQLGLYQYSSLRRVGCCIHSRLYSHVSSLKDPSASVNLY